MKWEIFRHFVADFFVETGTYIGDGTQYALDFGFKNVRTIELAEDLYKQCCERFAGQNNVKLYLGDSGEILWDVIRDIESRITFWLDGHYHPAGKSRRDNKKGVEWGKSKDGRWTPLERELGAIKKHPVKNHTILIDDVREFRTAGYGMVSKEQLENMVLDVNPDYTIRYFNGVVENDILAAYIRRGVS